MTRREFVIENYRENLVDDNAFGGIQGCPANYKKLVDADKSITSGTAYGACIMKLSIGPFATVTPVLIRIFVDSNAHSVG